MSNTNAYAMNQYKEVGTQAGLTDANPHKVIQMLLDGALTRIAEARIAIERNEIQEKNIALSKAISIISALQESLDSQSGGEIAANLENLYVYSKELLAGVMSSNDTGALKEASQLIQTIRESWNSIPQDMREPATAE
jgi:flagellar protein FliS